MIRYLQRKFSLFFFDTRFTEIFTGSIWALSARVLSTILGLLFSVVVARFYGAELVGIIAFINSILMFVTIFTVLGIDTSILKMLPEHFVKHSPTSAYKVYRKSQYMVVVSSIIVGLLLFLFSGSLAVKLFSKDHFSFYLRLVSIFLVFQSLMKLNTEAIRGLKRIRLFSMMLIFPQSFTLLFLLIIFVLFNSKNAPVYALLSGAAITGIIGRILIGYTFSKKKDGNDNVYFVSISSILSLSLPMLMTSTMAVMINQTGVIILGIFKAEAEMGYYSIAIKLANLTAFVLVAINSMAAPKFSELYHQNKMEDLFYVAKKSSKMIFYSSLPILMVLLIFGEYILSMGFGNDFSVAYVALVFLVIGQFINAISGSSGIFLNMTGNQKVFRNIMVIAALLNIGLNIILIPEYGIYGAALSSMISMSFWNIATIVYIKYKFGKTTGYFPGMNISFCKSGKL